VQPATADYAPLRVAGELAGHWARAGAGGGGVIVHFCHPSATAS
jgi:hypothetical protein